MKRLIIYLWQTNSSDPQSVFAPLSMATAAAAMGIHVEVHVIGPCIELFIRESSSRELRLELLNRSTGELIEDAMRTGVIFHACSTVMRSRERLASDLIDGFGEIIGMVTMIERATQQNTTVMTF